MSELVSAQTLMDQAASTVRSYWHDLEQSMPPGFAQNHPEAMARLVQACVADYAAGMIGSRLEAVAAALERQR